MRIPSPAKLQAVGLRSERLATYTENINRILGPLAQFLTWIAYIEFVLSIRAIILSVAK